MTFGGSGDWNLQAYLTTQIGPGTTAALHEVASRTETITLTGSSFVAPYTLTPLVVFSNLSLPAGQYYLVLGGTFASQSAWWAASFDANAIVTSGGNASVTDPNTFGGLSDPYLPASFFIPLDGNLWLTIEGDPAAGTVPEPGTWMLACAGVLALAWRARAHSQR